MAMVRAAEQGMRRAATARPRRGRTRHRSATCAKREAESGDARREASEIESAPGRNPSGAFACEGRRRDAIAAAIIAPLMSLPLPSLADAGDATDGPSSTEVAVPESAPVEPRPPPPPEPKVDPIRSYDFPAFRLGVPASFAQQDMDLVGKDDPESGPLSLGFGISAPGGRPKLKTNGVLAKFSSADTGVSVYVAYTVGAQFRPTFVQVRDISQYGSPEDVGGFVLPKDASGLQIKARKVSLPPRDTGTVAGTYTPPPKVYYTYKFLIEGEEETLVLAASGGKVYWLAVTAPKGPRSQEASKVAGKIVDSFRVKP